MTEQQKKVRDGLAVVGLVALYYFTIIYLPTRASK